MLSEKKNLKDNSSVARSIVPSWLDNSVSYAKINKLVTALYMVTDNMEHDEPIRLKLRTLGVEILSDIASLKKGTLDEKITVILSFLNITSDIGMISEMNCNILKKEFMELRNSIKEFTTENHLWFEDFMHREPKIDSSLKVSSGKRHSTRPTRIGVQKADTLMNVLNRVGNRDNLEIKNKRREKIITAIKDKAEGMNIKDIALSLQGVGETMGQKTLQRELISMVSDGVLKRNGEKRWSMYYLQTAATPTPIV